MKLKEWAAFVLLSLIWGSSFLWIKIAVAETAPVTVVGLRLFFGLAGVMLLPWVVWSCWVSRAARRRVLWGAVAALGVAVVAAATRTHFRYATRDEMTVSIREFSNAEYPEDPATRSVCFGKYHGRRLRLVKKDATHFDFAFEPLAPHVATITLRDIDASLFVTSLPEWTKADSDLRRIALTDREWNRQQVRFDAGSPHLAVTGGDGTELSHLFTVELAKNCLNAGLWEILLFTHENDEKTLYYQGWFTFPLGHYKDLFEHITGLSYWRHWYYLEHWFDPVGTPLRLDQLRTVRSEQRVAATFDRSERVIIEGEQTRKRRTTMAANVVTWGDFFDGRSVQFASFISPGHYSVQHPWNNKYPLIDRFESAVLRHIQSPATDRPLHELELIFSSSRGLGRYRFFVSGFDLDRLPQLAVNDYPQGLYMPMGIGIPPFFQKYDELTQQRPSHSPFFSLLLDDHDRWVDHHSFAIDGPVLHRDRDDPSRLHVYLLSYERHTLIAHIVVDVSRNLLHRS